MVGEAEAGFGHVTSPGVVQSLQCLAGSAPWEQTPLPLSTSLPMPIVLGAKDKQWPGQEAGPLPPLWMTMALGAQKGSWVKS